MLLDLKEADHSVPERKLVLKDDSFKVRVVHRIDASHVPHSGWTKLRFAGQSVETYLFQNRNRQIFPDRAFDSRIRVALAGYLREHHKQELTRGIQTFYAAPISRVCNELWIYWENRRTALHVAADGDLADPRIWEQLPLHLREVVLERGPTVMPEAIPGRERSVSREWAGRLLYNSIVLGRIFTLPP